MALRLSGLAHRSLAGRPLAGLSAPLSASGPRLGRPQPKAFSVASGLHHDEQAIDSSLFRVIRVPTIEEGRKAPQSVMELSDEKLYIMAEQEDHTACRERLLRNIMAVDDVDYSIANDKMKEIVAANNAMLGIATLPYKIGITGGLIIGVGSVPMVFDLSTAQWFNNLYVLEKEASPEDLETVYEVGAWTWGWMEPLIGTGSFVILAMQVARNQMVNMGLKPYTGWVKNRRSKSLVEQFPQYNSDFLRTFSRTATMTKNAQTLSH